MRKLLIGLIQLYRYTLSPFIGQHCRYTPSCSQYAIEAIRLHGTWRGSWLAIKRVGSCHPWHPGGYDPVPDSPESRHG